MFKRLKLNRLKAKARDHYLAYHARAGDAGAHMSNVIMGGRLTYHANKFNELVPKIKALDPDSPLEYLDTLE